MAYDINYKTISKKDQLRMIRNKYKTLKEIWLDPAYKNYTPYCRGRALIVKDILEEVYNWDADNDCSY